jgi:hypothetical protein
MLELSEKVRCPYQTPDEAFRQVFYDSSPRLKEISGARQTMALAAA